MPKIRDMTQIRAKEHMAKTLLLTHSYNRVNTILKQQFGKGLSDSQLSRLNKENLKERSIEPKDVNVVTALQKQVNTLRDKNHELTVENRVLRELIITVLTEKHTFLDEYLRNNKEKLK